MIFLVSECLTILAQKTEDKKYDVPQKDAENSIGGPREKGRGLVKEYVKQKETYFQLESDS